MNHPKQRQDVLFRLYDARAAKPRDGWMYENELRAALGDVEFALAVLVELGYIKAEGHKYRINGAGVLASEAAEASPIP